MRATLIHKTLTIFVIVVLIFVMAGSVSAFDKKRKGFILGFGLGPGFNSRTLTSTLNVTNVSGIGFESDAIKYEDKSDLHLINKESLDESFSKFAFVTNFRIGYAFSDKLMVYWSQSVAWFNNNDYITAIQQVDVVDTTFDGETIVSVDTSQYNYVSIDKDKDEITMAIGVGGIGATYFFKPKSPSLFVNLGVGLSTRSYPFWGTDPWVGLGFSGGIGYEFSPNWSTELTFFWAAPKGDTDEEPLKYENNSIALGLTINVLGY
jgi:hypothetical protein